MYHVRKPDSAQIADFLKVQAQQDFTYPHREDTRNQSAPAGFRVDHNRIRLGQGAAVYEQAKQALAEWQHYRFDWLHLHRPDAPPAAGQTVAALAHVLGIWVLNACRIVYVLEETEPFPRFAFAYGTLPDHVECGEERFQVELHPNDDSVWYDLYAFSRPNTLLSKIALPYVRSKQKQFAGESLQAMHQAVVKKSN